MSTALNTHYQQSLIPPAIGYQIKNRHKIRAIVICGLLLGASFFIDLAVGPGNLSISEIAQLVFSELFGHQDIDRLPQQIILWDIRLPVALMAVVVGAMLSVAGAQMQTILNNPLAEPFTLGIHSAASFGAALAIIVGQQVNTGIENSVLVTLCAFVFSLLTAALLYLFTRLRGSAPETLVLIGIALLFTFNALLGLLQFSATDFQLSQIVFWMMGSLSRADWDKVSICFWVLMAVLPLLVYRGWSLTTLRMGDEKAQSLGVNTSRLRIEILLIVSLLSATAVSFVGTIAFVGLVGPHIARMLVGEDLRFFLPMSLLAGALMMSLTSLVSKSLSTGIVYPVGIVTSLIGIPFFIILLLKNRRRYW